MTKYIKYTWELSDNFTSKTGKLTFCWKKLNTWWQENRNSRLRGHPEAMSAIADIAETVYFTNEILKKRSLWKWRKKNLAVTIEIHLFCLLLANKAGILKLEPCLPICVSYICNPIVVPRVYCFALFSIFRLWALGSYSQHQACNLSMSSS